MNFYKYLNLIILLFLLEVISDSSADEWKKLKRKLFALTLLHGIRVKTIIPLPVPVPLPVVVKRQRIPVILPPKRVPFLVPKPVPYYQIIPKFVPVYPKDSKAEAKQWPEEDFQLSAQTTHEEFLHPSDPGLGFGHTMGLNHDLFKLTAGGGHPSLHTELMPMESYEHQNKFNFHDFQESPPNFIDPFEGPLKKKMRKFKRKFKRPNFKPMKNLKAFQFSDDMEDEYQDLLMLSTEPKTKPEDSIDSNNPYSDGNQTNNNMSTNRNVGHIQSTNGLSVTQDMNKQLLNDFNQKDDKNRENENKEELFAESNSPGVKTTIKKIKVGEIRLRPNQLKALLSQNPRRES